METVAKPALVPVPREIEVPQELQYLDLKAQFQTIRDEVMDAIARVMESQHFILGSEVERFEEEIGRVIGARHSMSCASGSDALLLAMAATGIGAGDEVITSPFTFVATAGSIARLGAIPVFVDIDPTTFNISPELIEAAITSRTRAILPVHLFGLPADMDPILKIAKDHSLVVIEDAAQAIGACYAGKTVGSLGNFGCFSFFPSKNLGAAGDGGLVTTEDAGMAEKIRMLRVHGSKKKYHHDLLGTNSRLDALQAAILRVKLPHLDSWTAARQERADHYQELFRTASLSAHVSPPPEPSANYIHVYNQFTVRCEQRDGLREYLRRAGVPTEVYYPIPLHLQPAFRYLGYKPGQLPVAESASREVLSLPVYPELGRPQQDYVVQKISDFYAQ
jgi:dTDP-4-amino-4,6-dideoxygalactose transaminase